MGNSSSKSVHQQNIVDNDDDNILSEASLTRRVEDIHRYRFPIESPADDVVPTPFEYTAFISPDSPPLLPTLPPELIENLVSHLDNRSIKNLRLTCKHFSTIKLRISRVFLSANPLNIHVLRSIANHDVYRQGIIELIYDDARLCYSRTDYSDNVVPEDVNRPMTDMEWFQVERDLNIDELEHRKAADEPNRPKDLRIYRLVNAELSLGESWTYYQDLLRQQDDVIAHGADAEAFRYALQQFPALQRVTITPAAHGWLFTPLYETPMIRAFPYGFNYPIPRGWLTARFTDSNQEPAPWEDSKTRWRGYCLLTKILAQEHHRVSELRIDSHYLQSGLNYRLFEQPSQEYLDFICCLQHPDLKRLHLSLYVDFHWTPFRRNLLRNALAENLQLEYFSLETGMDISSYEPDYNPNQEWPPALQTFLPVGCWINLQYFRLWNFPVDSTDLISTLSQLPALQSLELGFLSIRSGTQRQLLENMRDSLRWHERLVQPKIKFAVPIPNAFIQGRAIWIDEEVEKFLYHGGENPFEDKHVDQVCYDMGVIKDAYDPGYERPYIHPRKHLELLQSNGYN
ncbi:uncharacterized protein TrAFT101_005855 [Trichoderma asperellum]|uniref:F-box domain-containing protein n=1 Tax=Trichoderma asperellum (strain ATCC 204424 / CBS 433.97 / NBRC 101777) TaxID=1042311 RepID=A0A2T3Z799_TRIA4|nr:hypothetical protein M441DRAFT_168186 [Trichoderma asperellum CBS 433.97]PTB40687.1 hypothetical protein M441DRAFT_168186 [Trichoderma asperellum CBS 433.97]UKZ90856.1 hypothetical protein TrAFT101_005855 [Trichoderma asperellum]